MKRLAIILLMGILFFNWYGYQWLSSYWQNSADRRLEASLDGNRYDESLLLSIKLPVTTLSYYNSSNTFERVDGQVEIGGVQYKYVKRRLFKDSLELLCIPNEAGMALQKATEDFFRQVNDLQQHSTPGKKAPANDHSNFSKDYCAHTNNDLLPGLAKVPVMILCGKDCGRLPVRYAPATENPPDRAPAALS